MAALWLPFIIGQHGVCGSHLFKKKVQGGFEACVGAFLLNENGEGMLSECAEIDLNLHSTYGGCRRQGDVVRKQLGDSSAKRFSLGMAVIPAMLRDLSRRIVTNDAGLHSLFEVNHVVE